MRSAAGVQTTVSTQINCRHLSFQPGDFDRIFDVHQTEGTGRHHDISAGIFGHLDSEHAHALFLFGLIKKHQSPAAATK